MRPICSHRQFTHPSHGASWHWSVEVREAIAAARRFPPEIQRGNRRRDQEKVARAGEVFRGRGTHLRRGREMYAKRGVEFTRAMANTPWHSREFVVKDCDGRLLAFGANPE